MERCEERCAHLVEGGGDALGAFGKRCRDESRHGRHECLRHGARELILRAKSGSRGPRADQGVRPTKVVGQAKACPTKASWCRLGLGCGAKASLCAGWSLA